jgi:hypothetical protein
VLLKARASGLLTEEKHLAALFRIPSTLVAPRPTHPALQVVNSVDAMRLFVRSDFPSLPALEFPGQQESVLERPRNLMGRICSFVKDLDCSTARRQELRLFASPQAWVPQM